MFMAMAEVAKKMRLRNAIGRIRNLAGILMLEKSSDRCVRIDYNTVIKSMVGTRKME